VGGQTIGDTLGSGATTTQPFNPIYSGSQSDPNRDLINENNAKLLRGEDLVDEAAIRRQAIADMQDRVDSLNQVYDNQLAEARRVGQGRVGSGSAILASRGLAGSARGESIKENVLGVNQRIEGGIQAERAAAIGALHTKANDNARAEAQRRREAIQSGGKAYLEHIKGEEARTTAGLGSLAQTFMDQGIDPQTMDPLELEEIAKNMGVSTQNIFAAYQGKKAAEDKKAEAEEIKALQAGDPLIERYSFAKDSGFTGTFIDYQRQVSNLKDTSDKEVAEKALSTVDIKRIQELYGFTPPLGSTLSQVTNFINANKGASPVELQKAVENLGVTGETPTTTNTNTQSTGSAQEAITFMNNSITDIQLKALKSRADKAGISSFFKGKKTDVKNYLSSIEPQIQEALDSGFSWQDILGNLTGAAETSDNQES
jgi:hypothetical protein